MVFMTWPLKPDGCAIEHKQYCFVRTPSRCGGLRRQTPNTMSLDEDARWLEWVTKQFESIAGDDKEIDLDEFKTALKVKEVRKWSGLIWGMVFVETWNEWLGNSFLGIGV